MKFLCITCDEALQHQATEGPSEGVMSILFACPGCGWEMAMYTNPWETQAVRSLDVQIGGRSGSAEPMSMLLGNLGQRRDDLPMPEGASASGEVPQCPFAEVVASAYHERQEAIPAISVPDRAGPTWTSEAEQRVNERIPSFVRSMARLGIEKYAREQGYTEITPAVLDEAKDIFMG